MRKVPKILGFTSRGLRFGALLLLMPCLSLLWMGAGYVSGAAPALGSSAAWVSERDVVVRVVLGRLLLALLPRRRLARGRLARGRLAALGPRRRAPRAAVLAITVARAVVVAAPPAAEHLHLVGDDVGVVALHAIIAGVVAVADATLDVDLRALAQVLLHDLGQLAEENHAVPLGLLLRVAVPVLANSGGRQADPGDRHSALGVAGLGIVAEVANQDDLVDSACHVSSSPQCPAPRRP